MFFMGCIMGTGFLFPVLVGLELVVVETELQRGRGRRDEKEKLGICNLQLVCPSHVDLALLLSPCLLEGERVGRRGRGGLQCRGQGGADRGDEPREAL